MIQPGPLSADAPPELTQLLRSYRELVESLGRSTGGEGLNVQQTGSRLNLSLGLDLPFDARITGGSNPYSWEEVVPGPGGTWSVKDGGGTGTSNAWETGDQTDVPSGTIVQMHAGPLTAAGAREYYFTAGGGGGGAAARTCDLAGLRTTDCLEATGPQNAVELKWD